MSAIEQETERDPAQELRETPRPRTLERSFGLIAGILFIGGAFAGIPSSLLIHPAPPASLYLITVAGVAVGLAAMVIPWERISRAWAHVAMIVAIVQVALTVALAGDPFVFYFVFIAIFAAYAFSDRNQVAIYIGLIAIALLLPIIVIPGSTRATAAQALAAIPAIALVAVMVAFLRERLEDNRRTTRRFAREALALSVRIGRLPAAPSSSTPSAEHKYRQPRHPGWRRAAIGTSTVLVVIAGLGALAAVGVALPGPIEKPFASVGIEPDHSSSSDGREGDVSSQARGPDSDSQAPDSPKPVAGDSPGGHSSPSASSASGKTESETLEGSAGDNEPGSAPAAGAPAATSGDDAASPGSTTPAPPTVAGASSGPKSTEPGTTTSITPPPQEPPSAPSIPDLGQNIRSALDNLLGQKGD